MFYSFYDTNQICNIQFYTQKLLFKMFSKSGDYNFNDTWEKLPESLTSDEAAVFLIELNEKEIQIKEGLAIAYIQSIENPVILLKSEDSNRIINNIKSLIKEKRLNQGIVKRLSNNKIFRLKAVMAVASVLFFLLIAGIFFKNKFWLNSASETLVKQTVTAPLFLLKVEKNETTIYREILLSDSSIVMLGQGSTVHWLDKFSDNSRDIYLEGRAWFKVKKGERPFNVIAKDVVTTAVGTEFMVSTFNPDKLLVKLVEGKVKVYGINANNTSKMINMEAGQQLTFDLKRKKFSLEIIPQKKIKRDQIAPSDSLVTIEPGFKNSINLEFIQAPLSKVLQNISSQFQVKLKFNKELDNHILVTGNFLPTDSLLNILNMLEQLTPLSFTHKGNVIMVEEN